MRGISKVAKAVGATLGTSGSNALIQTLERPGFLVTNDGFSVANSVKLADPLEELGRIILVEAINRANRASGDGSSTTCVLTQAILEEGSKYIGETSPMEIKRSLEACIPLIEQSVKNQTREVTIDTVGQVAAISAEDEGIGAMIQEIYQKIGKDGVIQWDVSKTPDDSYSIGTGITIHGATYVSPYMCDIDEGGNLSNTVRWSDVPVLLCRQKVTSAADFNTLFQELHNKDIREIAIFCDDIDVPVIADLIRTRAVRGFKSVVIKMPVLWNNEWWEDLALASGATIISGLSGVSLQKATEEHLGKFAHLTVTKEDTFVDGIKDMKVHIASLQEEGSDQALQRAQRLNTRTARYFVGGHSESSLAYRRLKVEDALNTASCALEHGIVPGGGLALFEISKIIENPILKAALQIPMKTIVSNSGFDKLIKSDFYLEVGKLAPGEGFDSKERRVRNMFKAGIVDAADVVLGAVKSAIGVAAAVLTTDSVVLYPKDEATQ